MHTHTYTELHFCKHTYKYWNMAKLLDFDVIVSTCYKTD